MFELSVPLALILLPLPIAVWVLLPPFKQPVPALRFPFFAEVASAAGLQPGPASTLLEQSKVQLIVTAVVWVFLVLALSQPQRLGEPIVQTKSKRDIILGVDLSGSMDQVDFEDQSGKNIQRLAGVKQVLDRFIEMRGDDRLSMIVFGSRAYIYVPFTHDTVSVRELLEQTTVGIAGPHTVLGDAIGLAIFSFETSDVQDRLLILLSDGADTGSRMSPINAAEIAAKKNIKIISIGIGDPLGKGEQKLDEVTLKKIAKLSDGAYYHAQGENSLYQIYASIDALLPQKVETSSYRPRIPLAPYFVIGAATLAVAFFAALVCISLTRSRRT
ncbi:VWA domain-containing protein [Polycladidibacter hongkongensis]|uniref:VWA domain-containing protein n=1 Tax=Polycladidibacter hongkongensis TaxID=1647556 RepID=UPI00082C824D|nr:VWA domain-containing protein [Pseudovibrio hongkongensis]